MIKRIETPHLTGFQFARMVPCFSSAVLGGGFYQACAVVNLYVDKDYAGMDPGADILAAVRTLGLPEPVVGLMTAVKMAQAVFLAEGPVQVLATAGVRNAVAAGLTPAVGAAGPGAGLGAGPCTINLLVHIDGLPSPAALAGAAITLTEAKVRALADAGVRCPATGAPATGTSTDAFAITCRGLGSELPFLGPVTPVGRLLADLTYRAVSESLRRG